VTLLCALCATAMELVPPWIVKVVIDDVIQAKQETLLPWALAGLVAAYLGKNVFASLRIRLNNTLEQTVVHELRSHVFAAVQRLSVTYFDNRSTGEIMSRLTNDTEHVERIFIDGVEAALTASLTLIGITVMLFALNWKLAALSLVPVPFLMWSRKCTASTMTSGRAPPRSADICRTRCRASGKRWDSAGRRMSSSGSTG
jgi:ATP-binding cassette subfamily B protein/subfamily B ATP-binding cassette protein MsbA